MKYLVIAGTLLVSTNLHSQKVVSYSDYQNHINQAELKAVDADFEGALDQYKISFGYKDAFAKDYYNAAVCASRLSNSKQASFYLQKVLEKGYDASFLRADTIFSEIFGGSDSSRVNKKPVKPFDTRLKHLLDSLLNADQEFRKKNPQSYHKGEWNDTIRSIDSTNVIKLREVINLNSFPSEAAIAVQPSSLIDFNWYALLIHQQKGSPNRFSDFSFPVLSAMARGDILPHRGAFLFRRLYGKDSLFGSGAVFKVVENKKPKYFYNEISQEQEKKIDENRKKYGLESLVDHRKKLKYFLEHKDIKFDFKLYDEVETIEADIINRIYPNLKAL